MRIIRGGLDDARVQAVLQHHATTARAQTARGSAHALDLSGLRAADITFWSAWEGEAVVGVGALRRLSWADGEIKSMHTVEASRRSGVGSAVLRHIIDAARGMGMSRVSLETGSWAYFEPARAFYRRHGFVECPPFGDYVEDPNSVFMTMGLSQETPHMPAGPTGEELVAISRSHKLLCQPMFVMTTVAPAGGMGAVLEHLQRHLEYWAEMERAKVLFAAGPQMPSDPSEPWSGTGMVIFRAPSLAAAQAIADADPMHRAGARSYRLQPWLLNHLVAGG
jgi:putative acetyltransferase